MKDILDFKNDVLFKYTLSNDQDPGCLYLLRMILKDVAGIESKSIKVTNPDLNPEHIEDKDMILDICVEDEQGQIINVEMQNSTLSRMQYQRFQIYGATLLSRQKKKGDDYITNIHRVYQIIFVDDIDKDNLMLIDRYISRNVNGQVEKHYLITRIYIYLPYIHILLQEKPLNQFSELELAIYIFKNGIDDDIMMMKEEVVKIMSKKLEDFNQDEILKDMALKRDLNRATHEAEKKDMYRLGKLEGKEEGINEGFFQATAESIVSVMDNLQLTIEEAMDALNIPIDSKVEYMRYINHQ